MRISDLHIQPPKFGLLLHSVVLGITSLLMERLCRKRGAGFLWGIANIIMAVCFLAILVVTYVANNIGYVGKDLPPVGIVIAALIIFTILGFPLAITYSVPYALISTHIESLGLDQGLSMGVLNLAIVIPQEKMYQWILRQKEEGSRVTTSDILAHLQSVGFTGAAGFILAVLWFISFGLALAIHLCCGWGINIKDEGSNHSQKICLVLLLLITFAAADGISWCSTYFGINKDECRFSWC